MGAIVFLNYSLFLCLLSTTIACTSGGGGKERQRSQLPVAGVIHEKIISKTTEGISYALFLPASLGKEKELPDGAPNKGKATMDVPSELRYPVILMFDPHGEGILPVKSYQELATRFGYILIGSNDSRNNQSRESSARIISGLLNEIQAAYPIDTNRIYAAGFSGGARVAVMAAMFNKEIRGVIGCGGGFPGGEQPTAADFDYFGIAGTADFNMNEMLQLDGVLNQLGFRHFITTYPGRHDWPPVTVMEEGFQWLSLNAMKDGTVKRDQDGVALIMEGFRERISMAKLQKQFIAAANLCTEAIQFADGLINFEEFSRELKDLQSLPAYKKQLAYRTMVLQKEETEQQKFMDALFTKDEAWWKNRIDRMNQSPMQGVNPEDTLMNARLKAFLSIICYANAKEAIRQRNREVAKSVINVYEMADPENPEPNYMRAVILLQRYDTAAAVAQLEKAVNKGFSDKVRMIQQPEFVMLKNSQAWFNLLQKIK